MIIKITVSKLKLKTSPMVNLNTIKSIVAGENPMCTLLRTSDLTGLSGRILSRI